MADPPADR